VISDGENLRYEKNMGDTQIQGQLLEIKLKNINSYKIFLNNLTKISMAVYLRDSTPTIKSRQGT
jgi:hypothetical protein